MPNSAQRLTRLDSTVEDDAERVSALLTERSLALAAPPRDVHAAARLTPVLVFHLGDERYGLPLGIAREVVPLSRTAVVPGVGPAIAGIVTWRGEFVVVFDLAPVLGGASAADERSLAVVLRGEEPRMAIAVDGVGDVIRVDPASLQPPEELQLKHTGLFKGVTRDAVLVLDGTALTARLERELRS